MPWILLYFMYVNPTKNVKKFLRRWIEALAVVNETEIDQVVFNKLRPSAVPKVQYPVIEIFTE